MTTDNSIDLEDAICALRDRPSMEAELAELRECLQSTTDAYVDKCQDCHDLEADNARLREESERLRAADRIREGYVYALEADNNDLGRISKGWQAHSEKLTAALKQIESYDSIKGDGLAKWLAALAIARAAQTKEEKMSEYERTGLSARDLNSLATYRGDYGRGEIQRLRNALRKIAEWEMRHFPRSYTKRAIYKMVAAVILEPPQTGGEDGEA